MVYVTNLGFVLRTNHLRNFSTKSEQFLVRETIFHLLILYGVKCFLLFFWIISITYVSVIIQWR